MTPLVICFSGRIGSGKTSVSQLVANILGAAWTGFGDFVRAEARIRSLDSESREVLQKLGEQFLEEEGADWLCRQVIARAKWTRKAHLIIDGVRHLDVLSTISNQLSSYRVILIHIDLRDDLERSRDLSAATRATAEKHSTEVDVLKTLPNEADLVVSSERPLQDVVEEVVVFIREYSQSN